MNFKMIQVSGLLVLTGLVAQGVQTTPKRPVGYVIRVGGNQPVLLLRQNPKSQVSLTAATLKKRVFLYQGDEFRVPAGSFVTYFDGPKVLTQPVRSGSPPGALGRYSGSTAPRSPRTQASRPLNTDPNKTQNSISKLIARDGFFDIPPVGPVTLGWVVTGRATATGVQIRPEGGSRHDFKIVSSGLKSNGGIELYSSDEIAAYLRNEVKRDSRFEIAVAFSSGETSQVRLTRLGSKGSSTLSLARNAWQRADQNAADWFETLNTYVSQLDEAGCPTQAGLLIVDWWMREPDLFASKAALSATALEFDLKAVDRLIGIHGLEDDK